MAADRVRDTLRVPLRCLPPFLHSLASMLSAGLAVDAALRSLQQQVRHPGLQRVVSRLRSETEQGNPFSAGCAAFPGVFGPALAGMIRAGETGGRLAEVLEETAVMLERRLKLRRSIQLAMVYPCIVIIVAVVLAASMTVYVLPRVAGMYESMDAELPRLTQSLMAGRRGMAGWALGSGIGLLVLIVGAGLMRQSLRGRIVWDWLVLHLPGFASLNRKLVSARFARACGLLLRSGVPVLHAMELAGDVTGNSIAAQALLSCRDRMAQGEPLSVSLCAWKFFPPTLSQMIEAGEHSGRLDDMLLKVAEYFDREVRSTVAVLAATMIPLFLLALGVLVAVLILAVLMPILQLPAVIRI